MFLLIDDDDTFKQLGKFQKKWPEEVRNIIENVEQLTALLAAEAKPEQIKKQHKFVRSEPMEILAVSEHGEHSKKLKAFRLYVWPNLDDRKLHVLGVGDKNDQPRDIVRLKKVAAKLIEQRDKRRKEREDQVRDS